MYTRSQRNLVCGTSTKQHSPLTQLLPGPQSSELELQAIPGAHALNRHIGLPLSESARHPREECKAAGWGGGCPCSGGGRCGGGSWPCCSSGKAVGWMQGMQRGGWEAGWSRNRGMTFLLHPCQACGAEMNVRGLLMRPRGVKHSLLLRAE